MSLRGSDGIYTSVETVQNSRMQKILAGSLAVKLQKIRDTAGENTVDEVVSIIHCEELSLVKCSFHY